VPTLLKVVFRRTPLVSIKDYVLSNLGAKSLVVLCVC